MSKVHGKDTVVLMGGYNLSDFFNDISVSRSVDTAETTTFGSAGSAKTFIAGLRDANADMSGFFDGAASGVDERMAVMFGAENNVVSIGWGGTTLGDRGTLFSGIGTSYEITGSMGDAVGVSASFQASGGADQGKWHHALGTESATQNSTGIDNGAASTNGYAANLHVTAITGTPAAVIKFQHSTDNVTFADVATFTTVTGITAEQKTGTGTVNRYTRSALTSLGGGASVTFAMIAARR